MFAKLAVNHMAVSRSLDLQLVVIGPTSTAPEFSFIYCKINRNINENLFSFGFSSFYFQISNCLFNVHLLRLGYITICFFSFQKFQSHSFPLENLYYI